MYFNIPNGKTEEIKMIFYKEFRPETFRWLLIFVFLTLITKWLLKCQNLYVNQKNGNISLINYFVERNKCAVIYI